jgi:transposase
MVGRGEIADKAWKQIVPLLPENGRRGGQRSEHRKVVNGILWRMCTGAPWRDLSSLYGPWQTCYDRFVRCRRAGTWDRLLAHIQTKSGVVGEIEWEVSVDDTVVLVSLHAAGARTRPSLKDAIKELCHPLEVALGTSRGGFSTKVHLACEAKAGHFRWFSRPDNDTPASSLEVYSMASGYHVFRE